MLIKEQRKKNQEPRRFSLKSNFFLLLVSCFFSLSATAQCAMCRASLESEGNKTKVEAVNDGIVFLMAVPYIIVAVIGFAIYKMYFKKTVSKE
ncbi:hypothetical protein [Flavobacterium sangjuense]|uniref:DUF4134 domain-containing protein n=1 Tax=Flavobacterium sangjuense TaxID=2518177 RepID=A0A4P7PRM1_9FLAO|nr:hypothetical protein [Flavobacterium sangjuense]QBZ96810.1 hypothetical protein GS03_00292 [Flavobacterium sangjuense]